MLGVCTGPMTTGTCKVFNCHPSRGPTDCTDGKCYCKPGFCSTGEKCVSSVNAVSEVGLHMVEDAKTSWVPVLFFSVLVAAIASVGFSLMRLVIVTRRRVHEQPPLLG